VLHTKQYTKLKQENRVKIFEYIKLGYGASWIAKTLDRSRSMIYRELHRNSDSIGCLYLSEAQKEALKILMASFADSFLLSFTLA
jgi:IS30 family transposase